MTSRKRQNMKATAALWLVFGLVPWSMAIGHGRVATLDEAGLITTGGLTDNRFYDSCVVE